MDLSATRKSPGSRKCLARGHPHHCGKPARCFFRCFWVEFPSDTMWHSSDSTKDILRISWYLRVSKPWKNPFQTRVVVEIWQKVRPEAPGLTFCFQIYCGKNLRVNWKISEISCEENELLTICFTPCLNHVVPTVSSAVNHPEGLGSKPTQAPGNLLWK